jgi:hypothetical protein
VNALDVVVFVALALGALLGFVRGAIHQVTSLIAWVASLALPYFLGAPLGHLLSQRYDLSYPIAFVAAAFALGLIAQVGTRLIIGLIRMVLGRVVRKIATIGQTPEEKEQHRRIQGGAADRALGALIGLGQWAVIAWLMLSGLALLEKPLREKGVKISFDSAVTYQLSQQHNAFTLIWANENARFKRQLRSEGI